MPETKDESKDSANTESDEFSPDVFLGDWKVIPVSESVETVSIKKIAFGKYEVSYSPPRHKPQTLYYNPFTKSLDSQKDSPEIDRSISYWQGPGDKRSLFASFSYKATVTSKERWAFETEDRGTWGAEDG